MRKQTHPWKSIVLIINPNVGLTVVTSSFIICFTMVVLPALSNPLVVRGGGQRQPIFGAPWLAFSTELTAWEFSFLYLWVLLCVILRAFWMCSDSWSGCQVWGLKGCWRKKTKSGRRWIHTIHSAPHQRSTTGTYKNLDLIYLNIYD